MTHRLTADVVVVDIEGTTSSTASITTGLYAYARPRLRPWIEAHGDDPEVAAAVARTAAEARLRPGASSAEVAAALQRWMDDDVKATPLKTLQGRIWARGFADGELTAHFFADVLPALRRWAAAGVGLAVFSSGSVAVQRPWFAHTPEGDLTPLFRGYFDTVNAGPKKRAASYRAIADALATPAARLLFLSDHPGELAAADEAGWQAVALRRHGEPYGEADFGDRLSAGGFDELAVFPS